MLIEGHIFTIKTKDSQNVADIQNVSTGVIISGLNVLKDQIAQGDLVFVVFGGDKPAWKTGLVGLATISRTPFDDGYDGKKNFRVGIDIITFFDHVTRGDLVSYPETFDTIGIAPITKWEPNQAITSVSKDKAVALLQAICEIRPEVKSDVEKLLGDEFSQIAVPVKRYVEVLKPFGESCEVDLRKEFIKWAPHKTPVRGKIASEATLEKYVQYLSCTEMPVSEEGKKCGSGWNGVIEFVTGKRQCKEYYQIISVKEFDEIFGILGGIFEGNKAPPGTIKANYDKVLDWASTAYFKHHSCFPAAYKAYHEFLEWRETQKKPEDKKEELPPDVDRLSVALKLFAEKRKDDGEGGWFDTGFDVNANIRGYFDALTVDVLKGFGEEKITELFCGLKGSDGKTFEPMWSGKPGQGWGNIKPNDPEAVQKIVDFLVLLKSDASVSARFLDKDFVRPAGFGRSVISELLMKFHPDTCLKHGERSHIALAWLGLIDFDWRNDYSDAEYKQVCGAAAKILGKMIDMGLPRQIAADGTEDTSKPDYLTVNEFIYFVNTNQDLIKEKVMNKQFKSVNGVKKPKGGTKKLSDFMDDELLKRLAAALRTKPFAILAGHSGTGKSQMVRKLAYMTCADEALMAESDKSNAPGNFCMIQVRPNWHDSTDLLGYYSELGKTYRSTDFVKFVCKAYAYPDIPFFVCLDEMNLAPVEQYFAEYLSALESAAVKKDDSGNDVFLTDALLPKTYPADEVMDADAVRFTESKEWFEKYGLTLPKNIFVVGTVNMDDTTCQFSRKVLDRAMTILMDKVDFDSMKDASKSAAPGKDDLLEADDVKKFLGGGIRAGVLDEDQVGLLKSVDAVLGKTPFAVAYRFANEYALYEDSLVALTGAAKNAELAKKAMDECVLMKVLPRVHGEDGYVTKLFNGDGGTTGLKGALGDDTLSGKKMKEILDRKTTYLSFWP